MTRFIWVPEAVPDTRCAGCRRFLDLPEGKKCATCLWYESWYPTA
jgi:LSD1 subclass zinc finger protein